MAPNEAVSAVFSKYATFSGRARRSEFWFWFLFVWVVNLVLGTLSKTSSIFSIVDGLFFLAVLVPSLAVTWRRLHDTDRSGAWWFIGLIPLVGWIILIVFCAQDSTPAANQYGPSPKAVAAYTG